MPLLFEARIDIGREPGCALEKLPGDSAGFIGGGVDGARRVDAASIGESSLSAAGTLGIFADTTLAVR